MTQFGTQDKSTATRQVQQQVQPTRLANATVTNSVHSGKSQINYYSQTRPERFRRPGTPNTPKWNKR